jgi:peptidoglycan/xylan/chitin deacetylase (PgdA/CDA1 family)
VTRPTRRALKLAASAADRLRRPRAGVVILCYHRVGAGSGLEIDLDEAVFDEQMAAVAETGRATTLADALDRLAAPTPEPAPAVVVTFDDGTADFAETAVPVLARHRVPVTLYLATSFVEGGDAPPPHARPLSWTALADACATGLVDVGSHTHGHVLLDRVSDADVCTELDRSIDLIGERLGCRPLDFAYPKAVAGSPGAERAVRARFRSAALAGTRANVAGRCDPYRLARSPIQVSDGMTYFARKLAGGMALEDGVRRVINRVRYAGART